MHVCIYCKILKTINPVLINLIVATLLLSRFCLVSFLQTPFIFSHKYNEFLLILIPLIVEMWILSKILTLNKKKKKLFLHELYLFIYIFLEFIGHRWKSTCCIIHLSHVYCNTFYITKFRVYISLHQHFFHLDLEENSKNHDYYLFEKSVYILTSSIFGTFI